MRRTDDLPNKAGNLLGITLGVFVALLLVVNVVAAGIFLAAGADITAIGGGEVGGIDRNLLRLVLLINNLGMFALTAAVALYFVFKTRWLEAAGLRTRASRDGWLYPLLVFVAALPLVGYSAYLNLQLPLPDWALANEENVNAMLEGILTMESFPEFLLAFLTVAVTPALGEELLLRGVVQRRILQEWVSPHAAIWIAATLFSALHLEFAGFLPRLLLGVLLGYAYYWSGSLWVPIVLHLCFNGFQVITAYVTGDFSPDTEIAPEDVPPWYFAVGSLLLTLWLGRFTQKKLSLEGSDHPGPLRE